MEKPILIKRLLRASGAGERQELAMYLRHLVNLGSTLPTWLTIVDLNKIIENPFDTSPLLMYH